MPSNYQPPLEQLVYPTVHTIIPHLSLSLLLQNSYSHQHNQPGSYTMMREIYDQGCAKKVQDLAASFPDQSPIDLLSDS